MNGHDSTPPVRDRGTPRTRAKNETAENNVTDAQLKVLLVDDDEDDYLLVRDLLSEMKRPRHVLEWASSYEGGVAAAARREHDVYLLDYHLGERTGLELLEAISSAGCEGPFIMLTGLGGYSVDVGGMVAGAVDFLRKSEVTASLLERSIRYAVDRKRVEAELRAAKAELEKTIKELNSSYWHLKKIQEVLPICMECGKVKTGESTWEDVVAYLKKNSLFLSHGYCPPCASEAVRQYSDR